MTSLTFIKSQRNGRILIYKGYEFRLTKRREEKTDWKCNECNARVTLQNDEVYKDTLAVHAHPPNKLRQDKKSLKAQLKDAVVKNPHVTIPRVYAEAREQFLHEDPEKYEERLASAMTLKSIKSTLYNERRKRMPGEASTRSEIIIEGEWSTTKDGRNFLLANDGSDEKILLFGTEAMFRKWCEADLTPMDGTFQMAPKLFLQLYTFHIKLRGDWFPAMFALLPNKSVNTYRRLFKLLKEKSRVLNIAIKEKRYQTDYEMAAMKSIQEEFPSSTTRGCYFHYSQAIWRKVQHEGLSEAYVNSDGNMPLKRLVRRLIGLPLIPLDRLDEMWEIIYEEKPENVENAKPDAVTHLMDYICENWMDDIYARFDRVIWNHYDNLGPRTTNHLEGWHSAFNKRFARSHPSLFAFVSALKDVQQKNDDDLGMLRHGAENRERNYKALRIEKNYQRLRDRLVAEEITTIEYLEAVGHIFANFDAA